MTERGSELQKLAVSGEGSRAVPAGGRLCLLYVTGAKCHGRQVVGAT